MKTLIKPIRPGSGPDSLEYTRMAKVVRGVYAAALSLMNGAQQ